MYNTMQHPSHYLGPLLCLGLLILFSGCATTNAVATKWSKTIHVPFFPQETFQCGPAALATVLNYWQGKTGQGKHVAPEEIAAAIYSPSARGVLGMDMERYAKGQGFRAEQVSGSLDRLKESIDAAIPTIVLVDYGFSVYQRNHFMVVKGYSADGVLVNSGAEESKSIGNEELLKVWKKTGHWMLLVTP